MFLMKLNMAAVSVESEEKHSTRVCLVRYLGGTGCESALARDIWSLRVDGMNLICCGGNEEEGKCKVLQ
jgi:hypothetical protein